MLFWCMAVCARGHGDILLEESLCEVLSVEEYLRGARPFPVTSLCVQMRLISVHVRVRHRKQEEEREKTLNTGLDLLQY